MNIKKTDSNKSKLNRLLFRNVFYFFVFLGLLVFFILEFLFFSKNLKKTLLKNKNLTKQNNDILKNIKNLEKKEEETKKYIDFWDKNFSENQKLLNGIDVTKTENFIKNIAEKNYFSNLSISYSSTVIAPKLENNLIQVYSILFTIKFSSITDINIYNFVNDLKNEFNYLMVIEKIYFERNNKIDSVFLNSLRNGVILSAVSGEIKLRIYGLGLKKME